MEAADGDVEGRRIVGRKNSFATPFEDPPSEASSPREQNGAPQTIGSIGGAGDSRRGRRGKTRRRGAPDEEEGSFAESRAGGACPRDDHGGPRATLRTSPMRGTPRTGGVGEAALRAERFGLFASPLRRAVALSCALLLLDAPSPFTPPPSFFVRAQSQDPTLLNGGSVLAMAGRECVAVALDARFGLGAQTISDSGAGSGAVGGGRIILPGPNVLSAFTGLNGDCVGLAEELSVRIAAKARRGRGFGFRDDRNGGDGEGGGLDTIGPRALTMLLSHVLYGRRDSPYYVEPIVAGLERTVTPLPARNGAAGEECTVEYRPYLCGTDVIGARSTSSSYVCAGAASRSLHGTAEALWRPDLEPEALVETCGRAFLSALERDCFSGYGAVVYLVTAPGSKGGSGGIVEYTLACRND